MIRLLALQARRDRVTLAVWVLGIAFLLLVTLQSARTEYGTTADRRSLLTVALATPVLLAFRGVTDGDSFGSAVHFQSYTWIAVVVGLMNTFLAVRHGRADEVAGRRELLDAAPIGRLAGPLGTLILAVVADLVLGLLVVAVDVAQGLPLPGALLSASGLALTGLAFFGVGLIASEVMPTSRAANGTATTVVLLAYALRAAGDALGRPDLGALRLEPAAPSGFSPIGWGERMLPFTRPTAWPLAALLLLAAVTIGVGLVLHARREPGASLVPERAGRPTAARGLRGPLGLAWRLQRPSLIGWTVGAALLALATPGLVTAAARIRFSGGSVQRIAESLGHSRAGIGTALTAAVLLIIGVLAAAAGVQAMLRAREEEASGRAEVLLAGGVSRVRWLAAWLAVAVATVLAVLAGSAVALLIGSAGEPARRIGDRLGQLAVQAPSALALTALAAVLVVALPRIAVAGGWALFAIAVAVGLFGGVLGLSADVTRFLPVGSVPALPTDDWGPTWCTIAVAAVLAATAVVVVRGRQVAP